MNTTKVKKLNNRILLKVGSTFAYRGTGMRPKKIPSNFDYIERYLTSILYQKEG